MMIWQQYYNGYTRGGLHVDYNFAYTNNYGQWDGETTMNDTDIEKIAEKVANKIMSQPLKVTTYSMRPPENRDTNLQHAITDIYAYASGAAYNAGKDNQ